MKPEDTDNTKIYGVRNGELELDGTVDMTPYLKDFFTALQSTDVEDDSKKLLSYIAEASTERGLDEKAIPLVSNTAVFLLYALICTNMTEEQLSDMAVDNAGFVAAISFDRLFRENGMNGKVKNRYIWHLVLWKIYCLQYNKAPDPIIGELFLSQFFCIAEIIYMSDSRQALSSFESVVRLGHEIASQAEMDNSSIQMLGLAYYYLGCIYRNNLNDATTASKHFSNAIKYLEKFCENPQMKLIVEECHKNI